MDLANLVRRAGATLLLAMLCLVTFAQGKTVTGTVVDGRAADWSKRISERYYCGSDYRFRR